MKNVLLFLLFAGIATQLHGSVATNESYITGPCACENDTAWTYQEDSHKVSPEKKPTENNEEIPADADSEEAVVIEIETDHFLI